MVYIQSLLNQVRTFTPIFSEVHNSYFYIVNPQFTCVLEVKKNSDILLHYKDIEDIPVSPINNEEEFNIFLLSTIFSGNISPIKID